MATARNRAAKPMEIVNQQRMTGSRLWQGTNEWKPSSASSFNSKPGQLPTLNNNSGPVPLKHLPQEPSGVQNVQSGPSQFDPSQSNFQHSGFHAQNVMHINTPGNMNPIQATPYVNITNFGGPIHPSDLDPQFAAQAGPQPQPASPFPMLHDVRSLIRIFESVAKLSFNKLPELLALAAMWHPDVLSEIEIALSYQRSAELQSSSALLESMVVQSLRDYQRMREGPPVQSTQYSQPQCSRGQDPPQQSQAQYPPVQQYPPQHIPPQDIQAGSGRDTNEGSEDDPGDESDQDESDTELLSFEGHTDRVDYILHAQYASRRDSQQMEITRETADDIGEGIQDIADQVHRDGSYVTKHRAMCALCNIGMIVIEARLLL